MATEYGRRPHKMSPTLGHILEEAGLVSEEMIDSLVKE